MTPSDAGASNKSIRDMFSIAFVCTANRCRSVMAHAIAVPQLAERGWPVQVYFAGTIDFTGDPPTIQTCITCCQNNTPPQKDGSTFVRDPPLQSIDRFFVMEHDHAKTLMKDYGVPLSRIALLGTFDPKSKQPEIEDPMGQASVEFDRCCSRIHRCILHYLDTTTEIPETPNHAGVAPLLPVAELEVRDLRLHRVACACEREVATAAAPPRKMSSVRVPFAFAQAKACRRNGR